MIELHTQVKYDKVKGKDTTIIKTIRINNKIVARYDESRGQIDLTPLKPHIGETVYIFEKSGKKYSHKAKIDRIDHVVEDGVEGDVLHLGPVATLFDISKAAAMEKVIKDRMNGGNEDAEVVS